MTVSHICPSGAPPPKKNWSARNSLVRLSVNITWESPWNAYVAKVAEDPRIMGIGHDWNDALLKMKRVIYFMDI
jgi:hypothetical protein